jgi:citronellol/citronellal dehydrogenase
MADAAHVIFNRDARSCTGNFFIDDEVLAGAGMSNLDQYAVTPGNRDFLPDFFVD